MIEPRIYRAAFLPALLAVVLVMFSFQTRPPAARAGTGGRRALRRRQAAALARADRRRASRTAAPARAGDRATAEFVADRFAARGFAVGAESPSCSASPRRAASS